MQGTGKTGLQGSKAIVLFLQDRINPVFYMDMCRQSECSLYLRYRNPDSFVGTLLDVQHRCKPHSFIQASTSRTQLFQFS